MDRSPPLHGTGNPRRLPQGNGKQRNQRKGSDNRGYWCLNRNRSRGGHLIHHLPGRDLPYQPCPPLGGRAVVSCLTGATACCSGLVRGAVAVTSAVTSAVRIRQPRLLLREIISTWPSFGSRCRPWLVMWCCCAPGARPTCRACCWRSVIR